MNKDIRVLTTFPRHPKTIKLKRLLGTWEPIIVLWLWAAENKPSGDLSGMDAEDIAIASCWDEDAIKLIEALCEVKFIKRVKNGAYVLHGWEEHNAYAANADKRSEKARLAAQARWGGKLKQCQNDATANNKHAPSNAPTPTPTPTPTKKNTSSGDEEGQDGVDFLITKRKRKLNGKRWVSFQKFWDAFGYKQGKREAADAWYDIPELTESLVSKIISAAEREAKRRPGIRKNGKTPKMAQGWISGFRWEDEIEETKTQAECTPTPFEHDYQDGL